MEQNMHMTQEMTNEMKQINIPKSVNVKDVPAHLFIKEFAEQLKKMGKFKVPEWLDYVKTATWKELAPYDKDWIYIRAAAIARQIYINKKGIGVGFLRTHFGGKEKRGTCTPKFHRATAKVIRHCMKELQRLNIIELLTLQEGEEELCTVGRKVSKKGMADMDRIAAKIAKEIYQQIAQCPVKQQ
eukprot:TRINITY_DN39041_c0_g1_i1.p2 TRINITY_DN39041_c0_g1~~TRINITY_DN39041_c0_g1_i1.p2  ORF type:complete len:185 (-),score=45.36 TRINITY_DN39041_c0_g1_i1:27-581(-)